jgi:hypothetical protein
MHERDARYHPPKRVYVAEVAAGAILAGSHPVRPLIAELAAERIAIGVVVALMAVVLMGCGYKGPKWLLIEYPDTADRRTMRFPGVRADTLDECIRQSHKVREMRRASEGAYQGMQCGSNCRFSVDLGSPLCDELTDIR